MELLLGSAAEIAGYNEIRKHVLLNPPPGSPASVMYRALDTGCPRWTPRAPNKREEAEVKEVKNMQDVVKAQLGDRKEVTKDDMSAVIATLGASWAQKLQVYQDAVNTMDQGVMV